MSGELTPEHLRNLVLAATNDPGAADLAKAKYILDRTRK